MVLVDTSVVQESALAQGRCPFSNPDLLLNSLALRHNLSVFSLDRHFETLSRLTGLILFKKTF